MSNQASETTRCSIEDRGELKATMDGRRLRIDELNMPEAPSRHCWWQRARRNLSLFIAGMYTGESCAGTPHRVRRSDKRDR